MYRLEFDLWLSLLNGGKLRTLARELDGIRPADIADFFELLTPQQAVLLFRLFRKDQAAEIFSFLEADRQEILVSSFADADLHELIEELYLDDAADLLEELPANLVKRVLSVASPETRRNLNRFLNYPENSAGSVMTSEFLNLVGSMTVSEAISYIRKAAPDRETVYVCYCIDETRHLLGVLDLLDLLYAAPDKTVFDVMDTNVVFAHTTDDREVVAEMIAKYDFLALPIVDNENRLVGIVTVDDAMDVVTEAATEDMERMAAMLPSDAPYLKTGVFSMYKNRILWLLFLMLSGMVSGFVLGGFEGVLAAVPLLVTFTPMLTGTGGNAGAQSATLVIRGMSLSEIGAGDWFRVLWKEVRVGLLVGLTLGALNLLRVLAFYPDNPQVFAIAVTLGISMLFTVVLAKSVGCLLPILAKRVGADPAVMASPLVTTIVDSLSLLIFLGISKLLLL